MRRIIAALLFVAGCVALHVFNRRGVNAEITPRPLLYLVADTQRELERIPLELTRVSEQKENEIGEELARNYGLRGRAQKDSEAQQMEAYLNRVGLTLTQGVRRKGIHYRFYYDPSNGLVNAAALPGGQIVFGRGLLRLLESEDELAAILGHETAHVDERHAIERLQYELKSRELGLEGAYRLGSLGVMLFEAGYTKEQEIEADRVGLGLAAGAGYSPGGALDAMQLLARLRTATQHPATSPVGELAGVPLQTLEEYFRSHPPENERIAALEAEITTHHWNQNQARRPLAVRSVFLAEMAAGLDRRGLFDRAIAKYKEALAAHPNYLPARTGLVQALWRSGDAAAASDAAREALRWDPNAVSTWELLARALAAADRQSAGKRFQQILEGSPPTRPDLGAMVHTELLGLLVYGGERVAEALREYQGLVQQEKSPVLLSNHRNRMGWWLYRAGKLQEAKAALEAARQVLPQYSGAELELAWVLSDLGSQADAQEMVSRGGPQSSHIGDPAALKALLQWRTEQRDAAKATFLLLAAADPVWLEPHWAVHNYSASAAAVLEQLRAAEMARRKQEEIRAGRTQSSLQSGATPR